MFLLFVVCLFVCLFFVVVVVVVVFLFLFFFGGGGVLFLQFPCDNIMIINVFSISVCVCVKGECQGGMRLIRFLFLIVAQESG